MGGELPQWGEVERPQQLKRLGGLRESGRAGTGSRLSQWLGIVRQREGGASGSAGRPDSPPCGGTPPWRRNKARTDTTFPFTDDFSNSFAFDSEIPSRYLGPVSPSSPSLWSLSITPSIFGRGSTPGHAESNPFEMSFGTPGGNDGHLFRDNSGDVDPGRTPGAFDSFSFDLGRGAGGRKRALSTPMIETPGGTRWGLGGEVSKRARRDESETSFGGTTAPSDLSRSLDDFSPLSSSVLTPTDSSSIPLPSFDGSFDKLSNDPYGSSYQFGLASPPAFQEHFSIPSPLPTTTISAPTHSTYQQFAFPAGTVHPSVNSVAPYLFLDQSGVAPSSEAPAAPEPTTGKGGKKGKKVAKLGKKRKKDEAQVSEGGEADDEARRKVFLERNRVAACKSRQKKKEKVGNLESRKLLLRPAPLPT